jgi:hypothetical protein
VLYIYNAEQWCDDCGEKIAREVKPPDDAFSCRAPLCHARPTAEAIGWPDGSVNPECWYDCPECGSGKVAMDDCDSDDYPQGDPNHDIEPNSCGSGVDCPKYEAPDEDEESDEDED